jgi:hypothetical protein
MSQCKQPNQQLDAYVGGLAERPIVRGAIPPTFSILIEDYFTRIRVADRFHFEKPGVLTATELKEVQGRTLSDMVRDHTDIDAITDNMFGMQNLGKTSDCVVGGGNNDTGTGNDTSGSYGVTSGFDISWQVNSAAGTIRITLVSTLVNEKGWIGMGIGSKKMMGADFHVGYFADGAWQVVDGHSSGGGSVDIDSENSLTIGECSFVDGTVTIVFERPLTATTSDQDVAIAKDQDMNIIFAYATSAYPNYHGFSAKYVTKLTLWSSPGAAPAPSPSSGGVDTKMLSLMVHGISMSLMWLVFIPLGIFVVRFRKG